MKVPLTWDREPLFEKLGNMKFSEMESMANEIRNYIVEIVSSGNGHLAPNLGTVELTLALYKVFPPDKNTVIWDTGHQSYTHKILTGRASSMGTIRKFGGISGYPSIHESEYDKFGVGHAATSIAAALGIEKAHSTKDMNGEVIAIIGDGAMTSGLAFEALNQVKPLSSKIKIVLNDNGMSISPSVGQLSNVILNRLRTAKTYRILDSKLRDFLRKNDLDWVSEKVKSSLKKLFLFDNFFEDFGIKYIGPIDGHDVKMLVRAFESLKEIEGPVVVHILTQKGKGLPYAEKNPTKFHSVSMIDSKSGISLEIKKGVYSYSEIFGKVLSIIANEDNRIVGITAAMEDGTGLKYFHAKHPDKFFDLGITEELCTTFAAGAAAQGLKPVIAIYSTFLQRAFDQVIHDVALQDLDVIFAIDRAGLVGEDGPTHHGVFDIAYMNLIPNMKLVAPSSISELSSMMKSVIGRIKGPLAIRYPKSSEFMDIMDVLSAPPLDNPFSWEKILDGKDGTILAVGSMVKIAVEASKKLESMGIHVGVYNCRSVKPLDMKTLNVIAMSPRIWTLEEGTVMGGFGSSVLLKAPTLRSKTEVIGIEDSFVEHGTRNELLEFAGLSAQKVTERIISNLKAEVREG